MSRLRNRVDALEGRDQKAGLMMVAGVKMNRAEAIHYYRTKHNAAADARWYQERGGAA
jgi:hypothetical protein